ncbi:hypothetical protein XELAEV_18045810mg [Xenopus laevis]|uniref:Uncharacterized protein n=1 Tax=Xenopus laevis TaxID=8355 RepID=A0A974H4L7_XENLA|nr:hypothetical protein XELAEV_18045810mg [Xenopus laevis]
MNRIEGRRNQDVTGNSLVLVMLLCTYSGKTPALHRKETRSKRSRQLVVMPLCSCSWKMTAKLKLHKNFVLYISLYFLQFQDLYLRSLISIFISMKFVSFHVKPHSLTARAT